MEPTFFRTREPADQHQQQRTRRRNQIVGGVIILALMGVALWAVLYFGGQPGPTERQPQPRDIPLSSTGAPSQATPTQTAPGPVPIPRPARPAQPPPPSGDTDLAVQGHVPPPPPAPDSLTADRKKELADKFAEAEKLLADRKFLSARALFNQVVDQGLPAATNEKCVQHLARLADEMIFSRIAVPGDPVTALFQVPPGGVLDKIARTHKVRADLLKRINGIADPKLLQANQSIKVVNGPFNALVDKSDFLLSVYVDLPGEQGAPAVPLLIRRFKVGLGELNSTPTGVWAVKKMELDQPWRNPRTGQLIPPNDPRYPLGKPGRWIGLDGRAGKALGQIGYGIHGTNERETVGKQASLGCIRMFDEEVAQLWELLRIEDSRVTIRE